MTVHLPWSPNQGTDTFSPPPFYPIPDPNTKLNITVTTTPSVEETICQEANRLVSGDRNKDYGEPLDECNAIADMWNAYLHFKYGVKQVLMAEDIAQMMVMMKITREANRHKRDNLVDIAGYAQVTERIYAERDRRMRGGDYDAVDSDQEPF